MSLCHQISNDCSTLTVFLLPLTTSSPQALQARIDEERKAMVAEAEARTEATASAREGAAAAAGAAQMAALEARYAAQVAASEACTEGAHKEMAALQAAFRAFQAQKAEEIAGLEERLVALIGNAAPGSAGICGGHHATAPGANRMPAAHVRAGRACARPARRAQVANAKRGGSAGGGTGGRAGVRQGGLRKPAPNRRSVDPSPWWGPAEEGSADVHMPHGGPDQAYPPYGQDAAGLSGTAAAEVEEAAAGDAAAAARREALFERLARQRAEALLVAARKALQSGKARIKLVARQLEAVRKGSVSVEEHGRVLHELASCKEALKTCRQESARRQRALQLLQGVANSTLLRPQSPACAGAAGGAPEPLLAQAAAAAATAATTAAQAASAAAFASSPLSQSQWQVLGIDESDGMAGAAAAAGRQGDSEDPFAQAATAAAAAAAAASSALDAERAVREETESKLREVKQAVERKNAIIRYLMLHAFTPTSKPGVTPTSRPYI